MGCAHAALDTLLAEDAQQPAQLLQPCAHVHHGSQRERRREQSAGDAAEDRAAGGRGAGLGGDRAVREAAQQGCAAESGSSPNGTPKIYVAYIYICRAMYVGSGRARLV